MDYAEIKESLEEQEEAIRRHNEQRQNAKLAKMDSRAVWDLAVNLGREHGQRISLEKQIERQRQQILRALEALHRGNHDDAKRILEAM